MGDRANAPGLSIIRRNGKTRYYWVADRASSKAQGYEPRTVRLHYDTEEERAHRCRVLTAELLEWLGQTEAPDKISYDGTIAGLIRAYQTDPDSPYQDVKETTRRSDYDPSLQILEQTVGKRRVDALTLHDFKRWHRKFAEPAEPGGEPRSRRAYGAMKMLRTIMTYGRLMRWPDCAEAKEILSAIRFKAPERRMTMLTAEQAEAIIAEALSRGLVSLALAQALQFECSLRQIDVIGEWTATRDLSGIVHRGKRWSTGVTWSDVDGTILTKQTSKTGSIGQWDLARCPLVIAVLDHVPDEQRIGPMIVCETTGRPYLKNHFQKIWRETARSVGVPDDVWNMDSRAGGISEGEAAGADPRDLQRHATHADFKTTQRYIRGTTITATSKVADLRAAARKKETK